MARNKETWKINLFSVGFHITETGEYKVHFYFTLDQDPERMLHYEFTADRAWDLAKSLEDKASSADACNEQAGGFYDEEYSSEEVYNIGYESD